MNKKPKKTTPPIGEEMRIARDMLWEPRLQPSRMPISDIAVPHDRTPSPKPKVRTLPEIIALTEEMKAGYGDTPATKAYEQKLLEEAAFIDIPRDRKSFDEAMDELDEE